MKKIESLISEEKMDKVDVVCEKEGYTRAEFMRRAIDNHLALRQTAAEISNAIREATINIIIGESKNLNN